MKSSYEKVKDLIPENQRENKKVKQELFYIKRDKLASQYLSFKAKAEKLSRTLNNKCNSVVGYLMGFADKPTGELKLVSHSSPPD